MGEVLSLQPVESKNLHQLLKNGISNAVANLSRKFECELSLKLTGVRDIAASDISNIFEKQEKLAVAICLKAPYASDRSIMIACDAEFLYSMLQVLTGRRSSMIVPMTDHDRLNLGEVCGEIGTALVDTLVDGGEMKLRSGPPVIVLDRAGAILDLALDGILEEGSCIYVVESKLSPHASVRGMFLIITSCVQLKQPDFVS